MMKIVGAHISILLLFVLSCSMTSFAQGKPEWVSEVERIFQQQEPRWKVERLSSHDTNPHHFYEDIVFRSGKLQAAVSIHVWQKLQDNEDTFKGQSIALNNILTRKVRIKLAIGEEGYMWKHPGSIAWPTLMFRQGHVQVKVFAPSVAIAKRFARLVAERIPPSNNGLNPTASQRAF